MAPGGSSVRSVALDLVARYLRLDLQGFERIPREGPGIIIANHSGFPGLDAVVLAHAIRRQTGRRPRIMAHHGFFDWWRPLREAAFRWRLREPRFSSALKTLKHGHLLILFPEGESGNMKSSLLRYQLQPFHTGFARLARASAVPIFPCLITGAEESHLNLGNLNLDAWISRLRVPLPLNLFPLPAKWRVKILEPVGSSPNVELSTEVASIRETLQLALKAEVGKREFVYFCAQPTGAVWIKSTAQRTPKPVKRESTGPIPPSFSDAERSMCTQGTPGSTNFCKKQAARM